MCHGSTDWCKPFGHSAFDTVLNVSPSASVRVNTWKDDDPMPGKSARTAYLEPRSSAQAQNVHANVVNPVKLDESRQRPPSVSGAETKCADEPLLNTKPRPARTLPPEVTTIVVRNIPARFAPTEPADLWPPEDKYNLLYIPFSFRRKRRSGIAFISMVSNPAAVEFTARWHGRKLVNINGAGCLDVLEAGVQGFMANFQRLKESRVDRLRNESYLPIVFKGKPKLDVRVLPDHMVSGATEADLLDSSVVDPVAAR